MNSKVLSKPELRLMVTLLMFFGLWHLGCDEPNVVISVDDKSPPSFSFSGRGSIPFFVVFELPSEFRSEEDMKRAKVIWEIRPKDYAHAQVPVGPITYGS